MVGMVREGVDVNWEVLQMVIRLYDYLYMSERYRAEGI